MSTITTLATGQVNASDTLTVILVEHEDMPPSVLIHWPGLGSPSVAAPRRFGAVALAVIALMDEAMKRLERLAAGRAVAPDPTAPRALTRLGGRGLSGHRPGCRWRAIAQFHFFTFSRDSWPLVILW